MVDKHRQYYGRRLKFITISFPHRDILEKTRRTRLSFQFFFHCFSFLRSCCPSASLRNTPPVPQHSLGGCTSSSNECAHFCVALLNLANGSDSCTLSLCNEQSWQGKWKGYFKQIHCRRTGQLVFKDSEIASFLCKLCDLGYVRTLNGPLQHCVN